MLPGKRGHREGRLRPQGPDGREFYASRVSQGSAFSIIRSHLLLSLAFLKGKEFLSVQEFPSRRGWRAGGQEPEREAEAGGGGGDRDLPNLPKASS